MSVSDTFLLRIKKVASDGYEVSALGELRNALLADLTSEIHAAVLWGLNDTHDPTAIWWLGEVARRGAILDALPILQSKLPLLPARKGFRDYRDDVRKACRELESIVAGRCPCRSASGSPESRSEMIVGQHWVDQKAYTEEYRVYCSICGRRFRVRKDSNYHHSRYRWRSVPGEGPWKRPVKP